VYCVLFDAVGRVPGRDGSSRERIGLWPECAARGAGQNERQGFGEIRQGFGEIRQGFGEIRQGFGELGAAEVAVGADGESAD